MKFVENGQFALYVDRILSSKDYYIDYMNQKTDSARFREAMYADTALRETAGFGEYNIEHISMTPPDDRMPAEKILGYLKDNNMIPPCENMYEGFDEYRKYIRENYDHGEFFTCIYPEDERLLYAAAKITRPKSMFVAGSYYGFFAIWAMKTIAENGGAAVLSDVDGEVCELARANFTRLGYGEYTEVCCEDASDLLARRAEPIDMLVLDATGNHEDPRPEYRGKRIYGAFLKDAKRLLHKNSVIVIHNMDEKPDMQPLIEELRAAGAIGANYDTYNGLGVYIIK